MADTVAMKTALNAPKKVTESVGNVQKGDQVKLKVASATAPKPVTGTAKAPEPAAPAAAAPVCVVGAVPLLCCAELMDVIVIVT